MLMQVLFIALFPGLSTIQLLIAMQEAVQNRLVERV